MRLKKLSLRAFRVYDEDVFAPCEGITVLHGDNAQGKTAVLEAIQLCCTGRSHRTLKDAEFVKNGRETAVIEAEAQRSDGSHTVRMALNPEQGRKLTINGKTASRSGELMGHMLGVLFSPEDLRMVKDGPVERRRFVDMELSQLKPSYYYALQRYNRALKQRGELLRSGRATADTLDVFDEQLVKEGSYIMEERAAFLKTLAVYALEAGKEVSGGREELRVSYHPNVDMSDGSLRDALAMDLILARDNDMRRGTTSRGPHRDDVDMRIGGMDVRAFGSQGQQRTAALAMKLSELRVMKELSGEWPLLMLDDVMSELDPGRRRKLLSHLPGVQTVVTCTDPEDLAGADIGLMVRVNAGKFYGAAEPTTKTPDEDIPDFLR